MEMSLIISITAILISIFALLFTYLQMRWNARTKFFSGFELANQMTIENPSLLKHVHGLSQDYSNEELQSLAYLSLIIDSYQHFYADIISNNYNRLQNDCIKSSTFLNKILRIEENQKRWQLLKNIYYGSFDDNFIKAIDRVIENENKKMKQNSIS